MDAHRDARDIGKRPLLRAVPNRRRSHILGLRLRHVVGYDFIATQRNNIAHLRRPGRAISQYAIGATCRRFPDTSRKPVSAESRITQSWRYAITGEFGVTVIPDQPNSSVASDDGRVEIMGKSGGGRRKVTEGISPNSAR